MNKWNIQQYSANEIQENIISRKFVIPPFQRNLVWKSQQKAAFIDSFERGLPFGTILLYHNEAENNYQVIDGLQRCYTIFEFLNNPAQFFDERKIDADIPSKIAAQLGFVGCDGSTAAICQHILKLLIDWVKFQHTTIQQVESMQYIGFSQALKTEFASLVQGKEFNIAEIIQPCLQEYVNRCKELSKIMIPAIIIEGDSSTLPTIFERVNKGGVKLTKYEIYAATWLATTFKLSDSSFESVISYNCQRYLSIHGEAATADFDADDYMRRKQVDAFELCFGFGKMLSEQYPHLFNKKEKIQEVESIAFTLINSCLAAHNGEASLLNSKLKEKVGVNIDLFLKRILECVSFVDKIVGKYNRFKLNSKNAVGPLHTEYQIVSLIASVFLMKYANLQLDDNDNVVSFALHLDIINLKWKKEQESSFKRNAGKKYVLDIFSQSWRGSGDSKMDRIITSQVYYCEEIKKEYFEETILHWLQKTTSEKSEYNRISNPNDQDKLFLAIIYLPLFTSADSLDGSEYDVEHLATKGLLKKQLKRFSGELRLPISSAANLCLLPQTENRSKGENTIYMDTKYLNKSKYSLQEIESKFTFTTLNDLEWITDMSLGQEMIKEKYLSYISCRSERIIKQIMMGYDNI